MPDDLVARNTGDSKDHKVVKTQTTLNTHETEVQKQRGISLGVNYAGIGAKIGVRVASRDTTGRG